MFIAAYPASRPGTRLRVRIDRAFLRSYAFAYTSTCRHHHRRSGAASAAHRPPTEIGLGTPPCTSSIGIDGLSDRVSPRTCRQQSPSRQRQHAPACTPPSPDRSRHPNKIGRRLLSAPLSGIRLTVARLYARCQASWGKDLAIRRGVLCTTSAPHIVGQINAFVPWLPPSASAATPCRGSLYVAPRPHVHADKA